MIIVFMEKYKGEREKKLLLIECHAINGAKVELRIEEGEEVKCKKT
jgi:hypothetical protein